MDIRLVVVRPFGPHSKGDMVTDATETQKILASEHAADVVRVGLPSVVNGSAAGAPGTSGKDGEEA